MITLQQLDEAIELYERCLKEKWGGFKIDAKRMDIGLCQFMDRNYGYRLSNDMPSPYKLNVICPHGWKIDKTHQERFQPRIVFLKTLREELIKEGYYEINE
jgi:hypothetical protein